MRPFDRATLGLIAVGGVLGASLRWLLSKPGGTQSGGWFAYAPNQSVTVGTDITGFERVDAGEALPATLGIPLGTLIANLLGCMLLGCLTALLARATSVPRRLIIAAATGFCGSLTTFSTFAVDIATLLNGRAPPELEGLRFERSYGTASVYLALSIVGAALAFWLGRTAVVPLSSSRPAAGGDPA